MLNYKELEKLVFNWLMNKHKEDNSFNFSLRQKASKGAELDYFIGTEKSNYFSTTFWILPVNYPGSASDLINLVFELKDDACFFHIQFNQTRNPYNDQNKFALKLIKNVKERTRDIVGFYENASVNKMEYFHVGDAKKAYTDINILLDEMYAVLSEIIPIVDEEIAKIKAKNGSFNASRISNEDFESMLEKFEKRKEKYSMGELEIIDPTNCKQVAEAVRAEINEDSEASRLIVIGKITNSFFWVKDSQKLIGDSLCHYEVLINVPKQKYFVEVHFEAIDTKDQLKFQPIFDKLPAEFSHIKWRKIGGIRSGEGIDFDDEDLVVKIKNELLSLEQSIGDDLRQIIRGENINSKAMKSNPLNQILFGPPGTGKTYNTINKALGIIGEDIQAKSRKDLKAKFEEKMAEGQIVFTTFHQSMSYEDFIEGIKPLKPEDGDVNVKYDVVPGIFKSLCEKAKSIHVNNKIDWDSPRYFKMSLGGKLRSDIHDWCIENSVIALGWGGHDDLSSLSKISNWTDYRNKFVELFPDVVAESRFNIQATFAFLNMKENDIVVISKGNHIIDAIGVVKGQYYWDDNSPSEYCHFRKVEWVVKNLNTIPDRFLKKQISQMSIYEFFDQDIKKDAFKEITASGTDAIAKPHVLIIDEINRGNVSQIFGELITLIEDDKRLGKDEALEVTLPYSKEKFGVPANLYIIGTMNTADRSVEALDTALRRRFSFEEMPPKPELISTEGVLKASVGILNGIDLPELLKRINKRIELLLDKDHQIGHSYFINVLSMADLKSAFQNKIIPLLQEYFFGDYSKIGLVLGKGFIEQQDSKEKIFAEFYDENASDYSERKTYILKNILDFTDQEFVNAIDTLMK